MSVGPRPTLRKILRLVSTAWFAIILIPGCSLPEPRDLDEEFARDPRNAQLFQENTRKMAQQMLDEIANSFQSRTCAAARLPDDDARTQLQSLLQPQLANFAQQVATSELASIFTSRSVRDTAIGAAPISQQTRVNVSRVELDISGDPLPQATARASGIIVSLALIRSLCSATDNSAGLSQIRAAMSPPKPNDFRGPLMGHFSQIGDLMTAKLLVTEAERSFENALFFVLGHETSHLLLDPSSGQVVGGEMREVRADLFGLFVGEAMTGRYQQEADKRAKLARTGHWQETNVSNIITMISSEGHRTLFELVYLKAGFQEPGGVHLSFEDRLHFLDAVGDQLATPRRR